MGRASPQAGPSGCTLNCGQPCVLRLDWEKTFLEHNFRDVSPQCERVGVVEQATNQEAHGEALS